MRSICAVCGVVAALAVPGVALADQPTSPPGAATAVTTPIRRALAEAWETRSSPAPMPQGRAAMTPAGPNIGTVGLGAIGGLSEFELGPSFRFWATDRIGVQAHLGFSGEDFGPENVDYLRFEPTVIVAIGDFGEGSVNVRPYAGGGIRLTRTDVGRFDNTQVKPVGVGGVEFGFRATPSFNVSAELSVAPDLDPDEFDFDRRVPRPSGVRLAALAHYFF